MTKSERLKIKEEKMRPYLDYDEVFSFPHLYMSARKCLLGVGWKASSQKYRSDLLLNVGKTYDTLARREFRSRGFYEFDIVERGKPRHIQSVHISERTVQRCLCDYSLTPLLSRSFIYDNGACLPEKGVGFAVERLKEHLRRYYRKHGSEGWFLRFDFSHYFDGIDHEKLKELLHKIYGRSSDLERLLFSLIDDFGDRGLGLGSQISQVCALAYPAEIDRFMTETMGIKYYGRYMDDGYMICEDRGRLSDCLAALRELCAERRIALNPEKTYISSLSKGVSFLKRRFVLTSTGKVLQIPSKRNASRERRKLRSFSYKAKSSAEASDRARRSFDSWLGQTKKTNACESVRRMTAVWRSSFKET